MAEGSFTYSGTIFGLGETLRVKVISEVEKINNGQGEDIVQSILRWIHGVRVRALHDLAVCHAMEFNRIWATVSED